MPAVPLSPRRHVCVLALIGLLMLLLPRAATAQENHPTLFLRPHCEPAAGAGQESCSLFDVVDPSTLRTPVLTPGAMLDLDVVLSNPNEDAITTVRLWISYDAETLEGVSINLSPALPAVIPGQSDFAPASGYAKIGARADEGKEPRDAILPVARVIYRVRQDTMASTTPLSFYDQRSGTEGHTVVTTVASPTVNLLTAPLGSLLVRLQASMPAPAPVAGGTSSTTLRTFGGTSGAVASSSAASVSSIPTTADGASFGLIQVQNVRVGTQDRRLYVTWDPLSHPRLQGYNVYYGTAPGKYLQRRSVSLASRGTVIEDLPTGKTYYVAVKGVDDRNRETAFSAEVSVEIGKPSTASAPILGSLETIGTVTPGMVAPKNPVEDITSSLPETSTVDVPGESGPRSALLLLLLGSAAIGTLLAMRRQTIARTSRMH